jgi:hypothetical protein
MQLWRCFALIFKVYGLFNVVCGLLWRCFAIVVALTVD